MDIYCVDFNNFVLYISLSTMSNLTKLNFMAFDIFERNYISWILDDKQIIDFLMKNHQ